MIWLWLLYAGLIVGILVWGVVVGLRFKNTLRYEPLPGDDIPLVSVIVPSRNEERNIGRCAGSLLRQDYPSVEFIFVDDDSIDATPRILANIASRDPRVTIVHTGGRPEGWNGKQWACHAGAQAASGQWLCFMDADTYAEPFLLRRTIGFVLAQQVDMLTLQPWFEMRGLWERIVLPIGLTPLLLVFPPDRVNDPEDSMCIANGQFILIRRATYDDVNGHAGVKDSLMDDYSLAQSVKKAGSRLFIANGADVMRVRMYTNLREIWAGAIKAAVQISGGWLSSITGLVAMLLVNVLPVAITVWALVVLNLPALIIMGGVVIFQMIYYSVLRMVAFRLPPWSGISYPVGGVIVIAILLDGMFRLATGRDIRWKGRSMIGRPGLPIAKERSSSGG